MHSLLASRPSEQGLDIGKMCRTCCSECEQHPEQGHNLLRTVSSIQSRGMFSSLHVLRPASTSIRVVLPAPEVPMRAQRMPGLQQQHHHLAQQLTALLVVTSRCTVHQADHITMCEARHARCAETYHFGMESQVGCCRHRKPSAESQISKVRRFGIANCRYTVSIYVGNSTHSQILA